MDKRYNEDRTEKEQNIPNREHSIHVVQRDRNKDARRGRSPAHIRTKNQGGSSDKSGTLP